MQCAACVTRLSQVLPPGLMLSRETTADLWIRQDGVKGKKSKDPTLKVRHGWGTQLNTLYIVRWMTAEASPRSCMLFGKLGESNRTAKNSVTAENYVAYCLGSYMVKGGPHWNFRLFFTSLWRQQTRGKWKDNIADSNSGSALEKSP